MKRIKSALVNAATAVTVELLTSCAAGELYQIGEMSSNVWYMVSHPFANMILHKLFIIAAQVFQHC